MDVFSNNVWNELVGQWMTLRRVVGFAAPLIGAPAWIAPALALGSLLALALAAGIALASLGALIVALLVVYLLLDRVFGVTVALAPH